jgi:PHD/YefM family antitoxin component YafN of YafNO toxin-antitoxin module
MEKNMRSVTIKGDKPLIVISVEEYENMKETLELLAFYPDLLKELQEERRKIEKGEFITLRDYRAKYKKR